MEIVNDLGRNKGNYYLCIIYLKPESAISPLILLMQC